MTIVRLLMCCCWLSIAQASIRVQEVPEEDRMVVAFEMSVPSMTTFSALNPFRLVKATSKMLKNSIFFRGFGNNDDDQHNSEFDYDYGSNSGHYLNEDFENPGRSFQNSRPGYLDEYPETTSNTVSNAGSATGPGFAPIDPRPTVGLGSELDPALGPSMPPPPVGVAPSPVEYHYSRFNYPPKPRQFQASQFQMSPYFSSLRRPPPINPTPNSDYDYEEVPVMVPVISGPKTKQAIERQRLKINSRPPLVKYPGYFDDMSETIRDLNDLPKSMAIQTLSGKKFANDEMSINELHEKLMAKKYKRFPYVKHNRPYDEEEDTSDDGFSLEHEWDQMDQEPEKEKEKFNIKKLYPKLRLKSSGKNKSSKGKKENEESPESAKKQEIEDRNESGVGFKYLTSGKSTFSSAGYEDMKLSA